MGLSSLEDPLPLIHSSVPLRIVSRGHTHRPLPFPLQGSPPLARNVIVRSYAMIQSQPDRMLASPGKSLLANRNPKRSVVVRKKAKPYSTDDPMRQWKPHVRFKREIVNKREAKARMQRAGTLSYFAPHHQHPRGNEVRLGSQIVDRSNELEIMFKNIRLVDDEHRARASQTPLVIPPLNNSLQSRSSAPSPASVVTTVDEDIHLPHVTSRNTDMDSLSDEEGMLVDNSPLRGLWIELFGDDDVKYD
jgi:hypothetical protein